MNNFRAGLTVIPTLGADAVSRLLSHHTQSFHWRGHLSRSFNISFDNGDVERRQRFYTAELRNSCAVTSFRPDVPIRKNYARGVGLNDLTQQLIEISRKLTINSILVFAVMEEFTVNMQHVVQITLQDDIHGYQETRDTLYNIALVYIWYII